MAGRHRKSRRRGLFWFHHRSYGCTFDVGHRIGVINGDLETFRRSNSNRVPVSGQLISTILCIGSRNHKCLSGIGVNRRGMSRLRKSAGKRFHRVRPCHAGTEYGEMAMLAPRHPEQTGRSFAMREGIGWKFLRDRQTDSRSGCIEFDSLPKILRNVSRAIAGDLPQHRRNRCPLVPGARKQ